MAYASIGTPEQLRDPNYTPALHRAIPLGIQHVLAMFVSNVTPAIIVAGAAGFGFGSNSPDFPELLYLIQMSMLFAGVATLLQTLTIGPIGAALPIVQGTSFAFLPVMIPAVAGQGVAGLAGLTALALLPATSGLGREMAAAVLDGVDGAWARRTGTTTPLGQVLDVQYDALGVLVACAVAVGTRRLPVYYLVAGAAYYLFQLGLWCRRRRGKPIYPCGSRTFARLMAGFQMGFLGIALLPIFSNKVLSVVAPVFLLPLLAGFVWDWQVVRGGVGKDLAQRCETLVAVLAAKGPPVLRGGLLVAGGGMLMASPAAPFSGSWLVPAGLGLMVVAGVAGRTAALLLSLVLAEIVAGIRKLTLYRRGI